MTPALEEARRMLDMARSDYDAFQVLKPAAHLRDAVVLFHAQQAMEKAIKAVLLAHEIPFGRTHNLLVLISLLVERNIDVPHSPEAAAVFNPYAVTFRYDDEDIALISREEAAAMADAVLAWATRKVAEKTPRDEFG